MIYYNTAMILCTPIPKAIKTHKIVQSYALKDVPCNNLFNLSNEKELNLVQCSILLAVITKMKLMTTHAVMAWKVIIKAKDD